MAPLANHSFACEFVAARSSPLRELQRSEQNLAEFQEIGFAGRGWAPSESDLALGLRLDHHNRNAAARHTIGPAVRCKKISSSWRRAVLHQCIRLLFGALAPGHHGYQRACDLIKRQASTGPVGSPVFADAGKTEPPSRFILSQTSAGSSQFFMQTKRLTPWPALPRSTWDYTYAYRVVTSK